MNKELEDGFRFAIEILSQLATNELLNGTGKDYDAFTLAESKLREMIKDKEATNEEVHGLG